MFNSTLKIIQINSNYCLKCSMLRSFQFFMKSTVYIWKFLQGAVKQNSTGDESRRGRVVKAANTHS